MITKLRLVKKNVKLLWVMRRDFRVVNDEGSSGKNLTPHPKNGVPGSRFQVPGLFQKFSRKIFFFFSRKKLDTKIKKVENQPGTGNLEPGRPHQKN